MDMENISKSALEIMGEAKWYNKYLIDEISPFLTGNILEIGYGTGNFSRLLTDYGKVTAIEINKDYLKNELAEGGITSGYGDIEKGKYFFKNSRFKTIICMNVLEHIKDDKKAIKNLCNLLAKDGRLILLVPAHQFLFSGFDKIIGHYRRYSKNNLSLKIKKSGLSVLSLKYFNWASALGWFIFIKILKRSSMPRNEVRIFNNIAKYILWTEKIVDPPFGLSIILVAQK